MYHVNVLLLGAQDGQHIQKDLDALVGRRRLLGELAHERDGGAWTGACPGAFKHPPVNSISPLPSPKRM